MSPARPAADPTTARAATARAATALAATAAGLLAGCAGGDAAPGPARRLLDALDAAHAGAIVADVLARAVVGGLLGLACGLAAFLALRRLGGYGWGWRHAGWLRALAAALTVAAATAAGAVVGAASGFLAGAERLLREGPLATDVLPVVGHAGADLVYELHRATAGPGDRPDPGLEAFRRGEAELDVTALRERLGRLEASAAQAAADRAVDQTLGRFPAWRGGTAERLARFALAWIGRSVVEAQVVEQVERLGPAGRVVTGMIDGLPAAAAAEGDPRTLSRDGLAAHLVARGVVPALLVPLRAVALEAQLGATLAALGVALGLAALFRLAEALRRRLPAPAHGQPGPEPPAPPGPGPAPA